MNRLWVVALTGIAALWCAPLAAASTSHLVTVAGTGTAGSTGDPGRALAATLNVPRGMAQLADGSILIAEWGGHRIRKLAADGTITTVAGTGTAGFGDVTGPATAANLWSPSDVAVAPDGVSFYIADTQNHRIRKVDASGTITKVAGSGSAFGGGFLGDYGPAGSAQFSYPTGIGVAANGDLYVADMSNNRIRRIVASPDGSIGPSNLIYTVAGDGVAGSTGDTGPALNARLNGPQDVLPMSGGEYVIADTVNSRIRRVDGSGIIRLVASGTCTAAVYTCGDGGPASAATFTSPSSLTTDGAGGYLIADTGDNRLRRIAADGTTSTLIGSGTACAAPTSICGDGLAPELGQLNAPRGALLAADGTIYVADTGDHRIRARAADPNTAPTGPTGAAGASGPDGPVGSTGPAGQAGPQGAAGPQGPIGLSGALGLSGSTGIAGTPGADGRPGRNASMSIPYLVALDNSYLVLRRGKGRSVRVYVSDGGKVTLRLTRKGTNARVVKATLNMAGRVRVKLPSLKRGSYRLTVTATLGTERSTDSATVRVR